jgi:uncharacterized protein YrrD
VRRLLKDVTGTRVMSRASAQKMGKVERVLLGVPPRRVVALQVGRDQLVDWRDVSGVGTDAVVVESEERVRQATDAREERAMAGDFDWKGKRVLSDHGNELGTVTEVELDEATGAIEAVLTTEGRVAAERLRALGSYCLVVRHEPGSELPG